MMRFTILGRLDGLNEYTNANRNNLYNGAQMKKKNENIVMKSLLQVKKETFTEPVFIRFHWIEPNKRRDKDNIASAHKWILDALVKCKILENDGWKNIIGFTDRFSVDKENPRIEVELLTEAEVNERKNKYINEHSFINEGKIMK